MNDPIRVFLVCRHRVMRQVLGRQLADEAQMRLTGEARDFDDETPALLSEGQADVVLLDAGLGRQRTLEVTRKLRQDFAIEVLPFGLDANDVEHVVQLLAAGAGGVSLKNVSLPDLLDDVRRVYRRRPRLGPPLLDATLERLRELLRAEPEARCFPAVTMTKRELQVLQHMASGLRNKEIASRLGITVPTIKNHVHNILTKFQVRRRRDAIRRAYESGLLEGESPWRSTLSSTL